MKKNNRNKKKIITKGKIKKKSNNIAKKIVSKKSIAPKTTKIKSKKIKKNIQFIKSKETKVTTRRQQPKHRTKHTEVLVNNKINLQQSRSFKRESFISGPTGIKPYKPVKNEEYMSSKQLAHFKNILNIWKEQLMSEMNRTVQHLKNNAANFPDPVDRASQEEEFNLELKTRERERKLIKKIDDSLEKIQGGDYGFCLDCGAEIGIKRLEARPTATQCIECKTIAEIREKQTGG